MFKLFSLSLVLISVQALAVEPDHQLLSFNVLDQANYFSNSLPNGLRVVVSKNKLGWEVSVRHGKNTDNLLYPQRNWHGAFPCQLSAWSHQSKTFPDIRVLPVRGSHIQLVVDLSNVTSAADSNKTRFTNGTIHVSWREGA